MDFDYASGKCVANLVRKFERQDAKVCEHFEFWWMSRDPYALLAFEREAEAQQITAGKIAAYERLASGEAFKAA